MELAPALHPIEADIGQLEQVIVNLAVNARDAMPERRHADDLDGQCRAREADAARQRDLVPGAYVMLAVSDTGEGMDAETLRQIFEPFFTTKEGARAPGSGSPPSTASSSRAAATSRSRASRAAARRSRSAFRAPAPARAARPPLRAVGGSETILLVEDEDLVRRLEREVLASTATRCSRPAARARRSSSPRHEGSSICC